MGFRSRLSLCIAITVLFSPVPSDAQISRRHDISWNACWAGDYTMERCCRSDIRHSDCWANSVFSFQECCPNADCWDGEFSYNACCSEELFPNEGNPQCWFQSFTYKRCCLLSEPGSSWAHSFMSMLDTSQFYGFDEFYTDAQYGEDFGYYSTGRVINVANPKGTNEFTHFTTYPMAMAPHFGNVICRSLLLMWIRLGKPSSFRVVEMGAGSGQLATDVKSCVHSNNLGVENQLWEEWRDSFDYIILERSPALAKRQRARGHFSVLADAQSSVSCEVMRDSIDALCWKDKLEKDRNACCGASSPKCWEDHAMKHRCCGSKASVVLSNELVDAFAPVKLRFGAFDLESHPVDSCNSWQEVKLVHLMHARDMEEVFAPAMGLDKFASAKLTQEFQDYTRDVFCIVANSTVAKAAFEALPANTTCLALVLGVIDVMEVAFRDLQMQTQTHNVVYRFKKDLEVRRRLKLAVSKVNRELDGFVAIPKSFYRQLRHKLKGTPLDDTVLVVTIPRRISTPVSTERCHMVKPYLKRHRKRIARVAKFYGMLGYPSIQVLLRPGEDEFVELAHCISEKDAYVVTIDYGATFETLTHSFSVDTAYDGIFIPPIPQALLQDLPECHRDWPVCAGRVDWTSFVDFTNLAAKGQMDYNWTTVFYGPQSLLEHVSDMHIGTSVVPGYSVVDRVQWVGRHISAWYGNDFEMGAGQQRWTSFKVLVQRKGRSPLSGDPERLTPPNDPNFNDAIVLSPSWPLDTQELDPCWTMDPTNLPLADWVRRNEELNRTAHETLNNMTVKRDTQLGIEYARNYEDAQLGIRLLDWLLRTVGCENMRRGRQKWENWQQLRWEAVWPREVLQNVGPRVINAIINGTTKGLPYECLVSRSFRLLCPESCATCA